MKEGLVSVIVPVFNRPRLLVESVNSVLAQSYGHFEIVIVDDASSDETPHVIRELQARDARIRSVRRENGGPGLARETGRLLAEGEFLQYLDSDDVLLPRKLELQVAALRAHPDCGVAYGRVRYRDESGGEIACDWKPNNLVVDTLFPSILLARWWETVTPLFRTSVTDAAGAWTDMRLEEDWEYDARIGALGVKLTFLDEVLAEHRDHAGGRLSRGAGSDPARLRDRARAHELIAGHARKAGLAATTPELRQFARELFHIARQCGAAGLTAESRRLVELAQELSDAPDVRIYRLLARAIGWRAAGRVAGMIDRLR